MSLPHPTVAETPPRSAAAPPYDPSVELGIRRSCNAECFRALELCQRIDEPSPGRCATSAITCYIGCRACISTYRACRTSTASGTDDECRHRELSCVSEKRRSQEGRTDVIRFSGGDGTAVESAVVIEGARNEDEGIVAESYWASRHHFGWRKGDQSLINHVSRQFDRITYVSPEGVEAVTFFDITAFFGK